MRRKYLSVNFYPLSAIQRSKWKTEIHSFINNNKTMSGRSIRNKDYNGASFALLLDLFCSIPPPLCPTSLSLYLLEFSAFQGVPRGLQIFHNKFTSAWQEHEKLFMCCWTVSPASTELKHIYGVYWVDSLPRSQIILL